MTKPRIDVDIAVVGGGMIGAAVALGFAKQGKTVAMIDRTPPKAFDATSSMDIRISALSNGTVGLLDELGVWQQVLAMRACPYTGLETWEEDEANALRFDAKSSGFSADRDVTQLGFMVENNTLQLALWQALSEHSNVRIFCPHHVKQLTGADNSIEWQATKPAIKRGIVLDNGQEISAHLIVAADGAQSWLRDALNIVVTQWDYRQRCLLIAVTTLNSQEKVTWQHFTPSGPRAFLPFINNNASLVWYDAPARIAELELMSNTQLRHEILQHFPARLGDIEVLRSASFALTRRHAKQYYKDNVVLVGDAAHSIHPLAGQGVNLGFKDVASLLAQVRAAQMEPSQTSWQQLVFLPAFEKIRKPDNLLMQSGMDLFYKGFRSEAYPIKLLRNASLHFINKNNQLKQLIMRYAIGG